MTRHRWLFVLPADLGHLLCMLPLVEELRRRGDEVFVFSSPSVEGHVDAAGGTLVEATTSGAFFDIGIAMSAAIDPSWFEPAWKFPLGLARVGLAFRRNVSAVTERTARATAELARELRVSAVVADATMCGPRFGAELAGAPFATVGTDPIWGYDEKGVFLNLPHSWLAHLPQRIVQDAIDVALPLRNVRRSLGLPRRAPGAPSDLHAQFVSPALHIVQAPVWYMDCGAGPNHVYVGPMCFSPPEGAELALALEVDDRTVLITGSTTGHPKAKTMLVETVRAFAATDLDVVVTAGAVGDIFGALPPNVRVITSFVRHDDLIPRVGVVVSHGGWGTVGRAMRCGIPSLVIPAFGPQFPVGKRIEAVDLGRTLPHDKLSPARVREVATALLTSARIRGNARRVAEELATPPSPAARAADALVTLVR